mgnify:FL=1
MTNFLRRFSVRPRIFGSLVALILLVVILLPVFIFDHNSLNAQLQQVVEVNAQAERLLLSAAVRVASSRANLLRYLRDAVPAPYEAADDVARALEYLAQAQALLEDPTQQQIRQLRDNLQQYATLIQEIQAARASGDVSRVASLEFQSQRLGNDIGVQIERIVAQSHQQLTVSSAELVAQSQRRLFLIIGVVAAALLISGLLALAVERSLSRPVAELRAGAEAFARGDLHATIPVAGRDELSVLAQTFNRMASELAASYADLEARVADRTRDLERRSAYLLAAADVSRAATAILDVEQLLAQSVEIIRERFQLYYVGLFLVDASGEWAVLRAGTGEAGRIMLARGHRLRVGEGMIGWAVANSEARIAAQAASDAVRKITPELPETRSEAAIPLRSRGQVIGALTVQDDKFNAFDESAVAVLQVMADQLAVTIDNARLYAETQSALEALRAASGVATRAAWEQMGREKRGFVGLSDGRILNLEADWQPDMAQAMRSGNPVQLDAQNLAVPLKSRDAVIGVVRLSKPEARGAWTSQELNLVNVLAERLGVTLESARLYEESQRRAFRERLVAEISNRLRASRDVETVLQATVRELGEVLGAAGTIRMKPLAADEVVESEG